MALNGFNQIMGGGLSLLATADSLLNAAGNVWQVVRAEDGSAAFTISSFISCDVRDESTVVDGPVEEGSFASYNKVQKPLEIKATVAIMGEEWVLSDALNSIDALARGTDLLNLVTPSAEYRDLNLEGYNYTHKVENGRGVLFVDLALKEIKQVAAQVSNEKIPVQKKKGKVQPTNKGKIQEKEKNESFIHKAIGVF